SAWRLVPSPETSTAIAKPTRGTLRGPGADGLDQHRVPAAADAQPALLDQLVDPLEDLVASQMRERPVAGEAVVGVAFDLLRPGAVEDLGAGRAAHTWGCGTGVRPHRRYGRQARARG